METNWIRDKHPGSAALVQGFVARRLLPILFHEEKILRRDADLNRWHFFWTNLLIFLFSNAHFLPWQTRLTEIHSLESLRGLRLQHLIDILRRYSGCEQRFGK
jgi:hypothetical protein